MTDPSNESQDDRLIELTTRYLDADLLSQELGELRANLQEPENRRAFVDVCLQGRLFSESIGNRLQQNILNCGPLPSGESPSLELPATELPATELPATTAGSPVLGFLNRSLGWIPGEVVVGVLVVFAVVAATWGLVQLHDHMVGGPKSNSVFLATLTACNDCRWKNNGLPMERADRLPAGSLELTSGIAEVTFDHGARVVIEGPAMLKLENAGQAYLAYGRLVAFVPPSAKGFTISSPSVTVVDLGTEFGLHVDAVGAADVEVFKGTVAASSTAQPDAKPVVLKVATAARFDLVRGQVPSLTKRPGRFVRQVDRRPESRPSIALVEEGGNSETGNLATRRCASAFARNVLGGHPVHRVENLSDGRYGNDYSWVSANDGPSFAGIRLGETCRIDSFAFGRDNLVSTNSAFKDRWDANYTLQYTTVVNPNEQTPADQWITIGTVNYHSDMPEIISGKILPWCRHRFQFNPVVATGIRLLVSQPGTAIDELEVYGHPLNESAPKKPAAHPAGHSSR